MFKRLDLPAERAKAPADLADATRLILPGVGSFDHAMTLLNRSENETWRAGDLILRLHRARQRARLQRLGGLALALGGRLGLGTIAIALVAIAVLLAMGRVPICECGYVKLWHGQINDSGNSQHIADWYTPSHIIHGMIFYALGWWMFVRKGWGGAEAFRWGFPLAVLLEAAWEVLENTPMVINRFRSVTANHGYSGDSVLNSAADIGWMSFGFWLALRLPVRVTVAVPAATLTL